MTRFSLFSSTMAVAAVAATLVGGNAMAADVVTGQGNSISFSDTLTGGAMRMVMGAEASSSYAGAAVFFKRNGNTGAWAQDKLVTEAGSGQLGKSVSMSGDGTLAIIGSPGSTNYYGAAYIYKYASNTWQKSFTVKVQGATGSTIQLGESVFMSHDGKTAFVGGKDDDEGTGAVWVFVLANNKWTQQAKLVPSDSTDFAGFGQSVSSSWDGSRVVIGASGDNNGIGASWVFERGTDKKWKQAGNKLVGSNSTASWSQGRSVAMNKDGDLFVVGAPSDTEKGTATVFVRQKSGSWVQKQRLVSPEPNASNFGESVAVAARSGKIVVGEPHYLGTGVYGELITFNGTPTTTYKALPAVKNTPCNYVGQSVAISSSADFLFAGGPLTGPGSSGAARGAACFFTMTNGNWKISGTPLAYK